ncbi:lytic transglycosylase domain-containing protein [Dehalobacter sp. DCM]|uniref:lytic transglycosylase domain-containing protein n=1 Tax=Dehalobacter sp. DCM TaxID=2907827 RepID=UPI00308201DB|nr:lytic transglycosylase domain-containing protein [Dehalobacter sp. DCM]
MVEKYAAENDIDPLLVIAVIREESRFIPKSKSAKGAVGLMQLMPNTAQDIAKKLGENFEQINLNDPDTNIRYGTWYLAQLEKEFSGNLVLTLASYNAGIGRVKGWLSEYPKATGAYQIEDIPFPETEDYATNVLKAYHQYKDLYGN